MNRWMSAVVNLVFCAIFATAFVLLFNLMSKHIHDFENNVRPTYDEMQRQANARDIPAALKQLRALRSKLWTNYRSANPEDLVVCDRVIRGMENSLFFGLRDSFDQSAVTDLQVLAIQSIHSPQPPNDVGIIMLFTISLTGFCLRIAPTIISIYRLFPRHPKKTSAVVVS